MLSRDVRSSAVASTISFDDSAAASCRGLLGARDVHVGDDDVTAALGDLQRDFPADAARAADDDDDLAAELALGRHPLQLGFLERPVLDRNASDRGSAT